MTQRIRLYPYKVTYISLSEYLSRSSNMLAFGIALHTDIVTALHADDATAKVEASIPYPIVVLSASRYPQRLGRGVIGQNRVQLTDKQKSIIADYIKDSGRGTPVPHRIAPSAFVPNPTPFSDRFRPTTSKVQPEFKTVPAPPTVFGDLSVGGFSFGASKPTPVPDATPIQGSDLVQAVPEPDQVVSSESNASSPKLWSPSTDYSLGDIISSPGTSTRTVPSYAVWPQLPTPESVTPAPKKKKSWRTALRFFLGAVSVVGVLAYIWHR